MQETMLLIKPLGKARKRFSLQSKKKTLSGYEQEALLSPPPEQIGYKLQRVIYENSRLNPSKGLPLLEADSIWELLGIPTNNQTTLEDEYKEIAAAINDRINEIQKLREENEKLSAELKLILAKWETE